jgi:hypothetical protein
MAINYHNLFRKKTAVDKDAHPWTEEEIDDYLDLASYHISYNYATPWIDFDDVTEKYKLPIVLLAAFEYWSGKAAEFVTKFDQSIGSGVGQRSASMFDRAIRMMGLIQDEISDLDIVKEGSGDILVGDLIKRSKFTGKLEPRSDDVRGNWLS